MIAWLTARWLRGGLAAVLLAFSLPAFAQPEPAAHLANVKRLYEQLYFSEAMTACQAALNAGRLSRADLLATLQLQGLIAASMGKDAVATEAFRRLLVIEPSSQLGPGHAPRIRRLFAAARRWSRTQGSIKIEAGAPPSARRTQPILISVRVASDPLAMVHRLTVWVRGSGSPGYLGLPSRMWAQARWRVEAAQIESLHRAARLEYHVVGVDLKGNQVALLGSAEAPEQISLLGPPLLPLPPPRLVPDRPRRGAVPLVRRWWFWTAIGVGAAVLATGLGAGLGTRSASSMVNAPVTVETGP